MTVKGPGMCLTLELKPEKILFLFLFFLFSLSSFAECQMTTLPPLYKTCNDSCTAPLECIDYSFVQMGKLCELVKPEKNEKPCLTKVEGVGGFFRWKHQPENTQGTKLNNVPAIRWTKAGCYLEKGEICDMNKHKDGKAETWEVCKMDHGCVTIKDKWGFCRYNSSPIFVIPSSLLLLVLAVTCSSI